LTNRAVTERAALMVTVHVSALPLHAPVQPVKNHSSMLLA
jgi:hypothetical protein